MWTLPRYFLPSPVAWPIVLLPPMGSPTLCRLLAMLCSGLCKIDAFTLCTKLVCGWWKVASQRKNIPSELFDIDRTGMRCSRVAPAQNHALDAANAHPVG